MSTRNYRKSVDKSKTLEELEYDVWEDPGDTTGLIRNCNRLRRKPLRNFTPSDCRLLIGQNISLSILVPMALQWLRENPFLEATYYHGDLLLSVLRAEKEFWLLHDDLWWNVQELILDAEFLMETLQTEICPAATEFKKYLPTLNNNV